MDTKRQTATCRIADLRRFALAAVLLLGTVPAAATTGDARVDAVAARLGTASLSVCENVEPDGAVTPCGGDISIVDSARYNAWAKAGRISLTSRLVNRSSDDELAFVIAHEMAHVILDHSGSSRKNELAADYWAAKLMFRSGFDANAASHVLARLQFRRVLGFPFSLLSHPSQSRRMESVRRALEEEAVLASAGAGIQTASATDPVISALP